MKPRVFIGSSKEGLDIANAVQANLCYNAECTVWTQGIFQLSSNTLDDLLASLERFDFGIFVFKPDDVAHMRDNKFNVVRDNVIFELGMFFGRLGKDRVFFVTPNEIDNFHLPSDLLGVMAGGYDGNRTDGNWLAALGPFTTQVNERLKKFVYESLTELASENKEVRQIAFEKKPFWEQQLFAALLKSRMEEIQKKLESIKKGHIFKKSVHYTVKEFRNWFSLCSTDIIRMVDIAETIYLNEMEKSWGPPGESGNIQDIKVVVDKIYAVCNEFLIWEIDLQTMVATDELQEVPKLMKGWSSTFIDEFMRLASILKDTFVEANVGRKEPVVIEIIFKRLPNIDRINNIIDKVVHKVINGELEYE